MRRYKVKKNQNPVSFRSSVCNSEQNIQEANSLFFVILFQHIYVSIRPSEKNPHSFDRRETACAIPKLLNYY